MKDKVDNSCERKIYRLSQEYKSYIDYAVPNNDTCHPNCENSADSVLLPPTYDEFQFPNWRCILRNFTACTSVSFTFTWFKAAKFHYDYSSSLNIVGSDVWEKKTDKRWNNVGSNRWMSKGV